MSKEPVRKSIDGIDYIFCRLPVKQSMKQLIKIMKIAGPALGAAANSLDTGSVKSIMDADLDYELVVKNLCENLDEDAMDAIVDVFMKNTLYGANKVSDIFDPHFQEHGLVHLGKVVTAAAKAEYGSFFAGKLGSLVEGALPGMTQEK